MTNSFKTVPVWNNGEWTEREFSTREDFRDYVFSMFKEPGQYELDETTRHFRAQAEIFEKEGMYCSYPDMTKDFIDYWEFEKKKSRNGVIFINGDKEWYLPRDYYFWINFLPIYDKIKHKTTFAQIWDVQLHMALYELLAELNYKHAVIVKKRQIASSYFHCAKLINAMWFEEGANLKIGASQSDLVGIEKGSWKYLDEYRNFLNTHTAWIRPMNPCAVGKWMNKYEVNDNGRIVTKGLKSSLSATSFEKSPTASVGQSTLYFFHEEAGIAPLMDKTYLYIKPSMQMGEITTGMFIAAGSVGELKSCEPLKEFMLNPEINDFYAVENHYIDEEGKIGKTGLFIPEQWGMPPYIDEFGNSLVEDALKALADRYELIKKTKDPASYQLEISQHPRYLSEAFAYRDISIFPTNVIKDQLTRIEDNEFPYELVNLEEDANGEIIVTRGTHSPIKEWPVKKADPDKEGAIQVWERPDEEIIYNEYIASIDPVKPVKTISSDSLNSIYVYKMPIRVNKRTANGTENFIEGGKIVCCWAGRFDNPKKNHQRMELILKWYKCKAIVEANVQDFINYMVEKNLGQRHLVKKSEMIFLKEYNLNTMTFNEYGWKNTTTIFKTVMLPFLINFLNEVILEEYDDEGNVTKIVHGVRRIPDKMVLMEMLGYSESKNVDRIVSLTALVCYLKAQEANHMAPVRYETDNNLENDRKLYKLKMSPFNLSNKQGLGYKKKLFSKLW